MRKLRNQPFLKKGAAFFLMVFLCMVLLLPVYAEAVYHPELLVDQAGLLDKDEFETLNCRLFDISKKYQFNVAVITTNNLGSYDIQGYADQTFVSSQYGYESTNNGILFVLSTDQRKWAFTRDGYGYDAFTDAGLQYISKHVKKKLSDDDYYEAFTVYADLCEKFLGKAATGKPYDSGSLPRDLPSPGAWLLIVGLGCALGVGATLLMKLQLRTVRRSPEARQYITEGSFQLAKEEDVYLYSTVSRVKKPDNDDRHSSGGDSISRSSGPSGISGSF